MARIGVNALYLIPGGVGGTEIYLRELLDALARLDSASEYFVFTNAETGADVAPRQANFRVVPQAVHARFRPARILWEQTVLPMEVARYRVEVLLNPGFTAPVFSRCANVTVFHDLQHLRHPEYFRWYDRPFWRVLLWASAQRSRRLIAVSQATCEDLKKFYPWTAGRIDVIPHGVDEAFFRLDRSRVGDFVLCVSTLHPHKNIERLIRAYLRKKRDFKLMIAGMRGFQTREIEKLVTPEIEVTGWVSRKRLLELYAGARAFVYPSTFEGFGMPVLEAMAAGIPTACSSIAPLREVAGDAALLFDPLSEDAIAEGLDRITGDETLRARLAEAGPRRAREFTWERSAERTLAALTK